MMEEVTQVEGTGIIAPPVPQLSSPAPPSGPPPTSYPLASNPANNVPVSSFTPQEAYQSPAAIPPPVMHNTPLSSTVVMPDIPQYDAVSPQDSTGDAGGGMWGWIKSASQNSFVQSVVEKTKTGVDKMITTLDPGMTPYLRLGGDIFIVVASEKEVKWGAVRDAFQKVFGTVDVKCMPAQSGVAPQPVGYAAGVRGAQDRINYLRRSGLIDEAQLCVSVESFIAELLPDKWFDIGCIVLQDPVRNINIELFTQAVPIPANIVSYIQSTTPSDYNLSWSGLSVTIGQAFQQQMPWIEPSDWHKTLTGQSRRNLIYDAALTLAGLYKEKLPKTTVGQQI